MWRAWILFFCIIYRFRSSATTETCTYIIYTYRCGSYILTCIIITFYQYSSNRGLSNTSWYYIRTSRYGVHCIHIYLQYLYTILLKSWRRLVNVAVKPAWPRSYTQYAHTRHVIILYRTLTLTNIFIHICIQTYSFVKIRAGQRLSSGTDTKYIIYRVFDASVWPNCRVARTKS